MPGDRDAETDRRTEFLLDLNSAKIKRLESALEKNWIAHLMLAGIGIAVVLDIANLPALLANYFTKGQYDEKAVAAIVLAVLLYYFMKLGYLLTSFVEASRLHEFLLKAYLGEQFEDPKMLPLRKSTNFFVEAFSAGTSAKTGRSFSPYLLVTSVVVSIAQATALFSVVQAYKLDRWLPCKLLTCAAVLVILFIVLGRLGKPPFQTALGIVAGGAVLVWVLIALSRHDWSLVVLLLCAVVFAILYILFWNSQKNHPQTILVVVPSALMVVIWLIIFAAAAPEGVSGPNKLNPATYQEDF